MTTALRWRIFTLQIVAVLILGLASWAGFYGGTFAHDQISSQLKEQQISFPADQQSGLPQNLQQYAGQQVVNGDQANAYATKFIGLHLQTIGQGHPYSYWSGLALTEKDPTLQAKYNTTANTLFKGETLRSLLTLSWTFWVIGDVALYAGIALASAAGIVLIALIFEIISAIRAQTPKMTSPVKGTPLSIAA
jgi:hypothetical protein